MQFFGGGRRSVFEKLQTTGWRSPEERDTLLVQLRESAMRPAEVIPLLWSSDAAVRGCVADLFLSQADIPSLIELFERGNEQPQHIRAYATRG